MNKSKLNAMVDFKKECIDKYGDIPTNISTAAQAAFLKGYEMAQKHIQDARREFEPSFYEQREDAYKAGYEDGAADTEMLNKWGPKAALEQIKDRHEIVVNDGPVLIPVKD